MIPLAICIERELPIGIGRQYPLLDWLGLAQIKRRNDWSNRPQMSVQVNRIDSAGTDKNETVPFGAGQLHQIPAADVTASEGRF